MRVVVPPVVVRERIYRIVSPVASLLEVEEWVGEWWEPSVLTLSSVSAAPRASEHELSHHGVPYVDWGIEVERATSRAIEAMMLAQPDRRPNDLKLAPTEAGATGGRRRKLYPGSKRFRRGTVKTSGRETPRGTGKRATDGGDASAAPWSGPWRRATDLLPDARPDAKWPDARRRDQARQDQARQDQPRQDQPRQDQPRQDQPRH
jgi:hypothetical protein